MITTITSQSHHLQCDFEHNVSKLVFPAISHCCEHVSNAFKAASLSKELNLDFKK